MTAHSLDPSRSSRREFLTGVARSAVTLASAPAALAWHTQARAADQAKRKSPIVDTHMHVWSGDPVRFPFEHPYEAKFKPPKIGATVEMLVEEMDQNGIDYCVLVQTIYHGWDNTYTAHCVKAHPKRFKGHGLIDPTKSDTAEKLEYWVRKHGLVGMRLSPIYYLKGAHGGDAWLNAKTSYPLWKKAEELGAVFNFFIATQQLPKLEDMIRRYPKVSVVIDHLARLALKGKDPMTEVKKLTALAAYPNVSVKVSELRAVSATGEYPYKDTYPWVKRVYDAFGPDRLLFGTGYPGAVRAAYDAPSLEQELALIRSEIPFFTAEDREKILGRNAVRIWKFGS
jgi:predicted TIM-barrel fold metal-dependent hydrolase